MKKNIIIVLTAVALMGTGCASFNFTPNQQAAITAAAALGTAYDLQQRPTDLPYFVAAEQELYSIANGTNAVTAKSVEAIMTSSGQTNQFVNMALVTGIQLANGFIASNQSTNSQSVNVVCGWLADGISQSVGNQLKSLKVHKK